MSTPGGGALAAFRLDDPEAIEAADPGGLLRLIASSAAQVRTSLRAAEESGLPASRPRAIVVAGAGASAFAGEVLAAVCGIRSSVQVTVVRGHQLPGWVGAADLVAAVSASGTREETLALAGEAVRRGCDFLGVGPARSPLADIATQARGASFVPVTPGPGRSQLWALTVPLLVAASRVGVLGLAPEAFEATAAVLEEVSHQCRPSSEAFVNPAKSLALDLAGTLPLVWGGSALASMAARRFASLLALNSKYPALSGNFPEIGYDQIAVLDGPIVPGPAPAFPAAEFPGGGFPGGELPAGEGPGRGFSDAGFSEAGFPGGEFPGGRLPADGDFDDLDDDHRTGLAEPRLVLIADEGGEHPAVTRMRSATSALAGERGILVSELVMAGEDPLLRLARVVQMLDYTTAYLAIAGGLDPLASPARGDLRDLASRAVPERPAGTADRPDGS